MIEFHLEKRTGVAPYMQLVQQVKQALRLGLLKPGDQLPTVREVVSKIAINPNTVFKAYRELEHEGLVESRPGLGTFVQKSLANSSDPDLQEALRHELRRWLYKAFEAGLESEDITALFADTLRQLQKGDKPSLT
ncbi:GntR family transcriptional regulator [Thermosporothrix hazakensis]|jgi:GntR family transcriptional regulator|uniref:GntR family transcriptional regulator n=2 Tax=Thermosporothrix TaxID=768650 RepID=A0A326U0Z1_THEHA|nr:GntR family transcriptional regulator [Thermosporothrix hazakensis]PZW24109.1 GntR family transcriptional regulator [Thermosporothrix hazakensis]BBH87897.1 GntR family transcriptional regulator [Thermosporothrix sp. COM3]GCE50321.1 GntR family transcriptional regulator [Thermosporothrix hazakensis]